MEYCSSSSRDSNGEDISASAKSQSSPKECSMCGDVGFDKELFQCKSCLFRYQHTYCSSLYPKLDLCFPSCEWCIYLKARQIRTPATDDNGASPKASGSPLKLLLEAVEKHSVSERGLKRRRRNPSACGVAGSIPKHAGEPATSPRAAAKRPRGSAESMDTRTIHGSSALQRWRQIAKSRLQNGSASSSSSPTRAGSARRYKLLADFLC